MSEVVLKLIPIMEKYEELNKDYIKEAIKENISEKGRTILYEYAIKNKEKECLRIIRYMDKEMIKYKPNLTK